MGLSTYMKAYNYVSDAFDVELHALLKDAIEDVVPLDIGLRHNSTPNIHIEIPIATWHRGHTVDGFLYALANDPDSDEYELHLDRDDLLDVVLRCRDYSFNPTEAMKYSFGTSENEEWIAEQFLRLERALTDFLLDARLKNWTLKVWRSY